MQARRCYKMRCYRRYCFMGVRDRKISSNTDRRAVEREWEWPSVADVLEISGLGSIKEYIQQRQATITVHNACRIIFDLCTGGGEDARVQSIHEVGETGRGKGGRVTRNVSQTIKITTTSVLINVFKWMKKAHIFWCTFIHPFLEEKRISPLHPAVDS